ncbi:MAG: peptidase S8 [Frankiaceae bacterium]
MNRRLVLAAASALAIAAPFAASSAANAAPSPTGTTHRVANVCPRASAGYAACMAKVSFNVDKNGKPVPSAATPSGYFPADLQSAYGLAGASSGGRTVAIVDAYDDPTAEADLGVYRSQFGLSACTTANGCFKKVGQTGGKVPRSNASWAQEISLDVDMVSAICPDCHILLVEASSNSFSNLAAAVGYAASVPGVIAISNSYGGSDNTNASQYENAAAAGIAVTASSGDGGYGVESPASYTHVVGVGGTHLTRSGTTWSETAWNGAGSGCSTINANPGWQTGTQCAKKAIADVSAVADPNTGVAVYDSTAYQGLSGWLVFGGTSVSSPIIASVYALAHNFGTYAGQYTWGHASGLHDVTSGSNGTCSPSLWCHAVTGWDGPTGLGTPNGLSAF